MSTYRVTELTLESGLLNEQFLRDSEALLCLQSNCVARKMHTPSLHYDLYRSLGFGDPYKIRRPKKSSLENPSPRNLARKEDRPALGSMLAFKHPKHSDKFCKLAFLFGQYNMGDGQKYYFNDEEYRESCQYYDKCNSALGVMKKQRLHYFHHCLSSLVNSPVCKTVKKIVFPKGIGCGAAGGIWEDYKTAIYAFASLLNTGIQVFIVAKEGTETDRSDRHRTL